MGCPNEQEESENTHREVVCATSAGQNRGGTQYQHLLLTICKGVVRQFSNAHDRGENVLLDRILVQRDVIQIAVLHQRFDQCRHII